MGGKLPKSTAVKKASGTLRPCREKSSSRARSIASDFTLTMEPPVGLTKDAREAWKIAISCAPKGLLLATDLSVLERWARNYALYRKLAKSVDKEGTTITFLKGDGCEIIAPNPNVALLLKVQQVLALCEKELGFTPASRARVNVSTNEEPINDFDGF